ncbi:MAG: M4 family metallopeptidase [Bacteroidales bacterium]|nr:M4 family metallopeptidase [Bacteroidales bacterium]
MVEYINGVYFNDLNLPHIPTITHKEAQEIATKETNTNTKDNFLSVESELIIAPAKGIFTKENLRLCYKVRADKYYFYIDAINGEIINKTTFVTNISLPGTANTLYNGARSIDCNFQDDQYILFDSARNIFTYDGTNDSSWITETAFENPTFFSNSNNNWDSLPYLTEVIIEKINNNWYSPITDEQPDIFIEILNSENEIVYRSETIMNKYPILEFNKINLILNDSEYRIVIIDNNYEFANDTCGIIQIKIQQGSSTFSNNGNIGIYKINGCKNHIATDVHWGMGKTYDYFLSRFQRKSFDDNKAEIISWINPNLMDQWDHNNAFAAHYLESEKTYNLFCFGLGDEISMNPLVSLDIIAHEFTHLITQYTANLIYQGESGALNESFSDIFGVCVEQYSNDGSNWTIGEGCTKDIPFMRSLEKPDSPSLLYTLPDNLYSLDYRQPDTYKGKFWTNTQDYTNDYGGVHQNNSVMNYWFYLLCEGGSGINDNDSAFLVKAIGIEKASEIAYSTLNQYLTPYSQFADTYTASLKATETIYGSESDEWWAVKNAWYAVGVITNDPNSFCSGQIILSEKEGSFDDGSGNANYAPFSACQWLIAPPGATSITLNITKSDIEPGYDSLIIYASLYPDLDYAIAVWYGNTLPEEPITIEGGLLLVEFKSDDIGQAEGWEVSYTTTTVPTCHGYTIYTETEGTITDNSGSSLNYGNNQDCFWSIAPPGVDSIEFDFSLFDTEIEYDWIAIYDGEIDNINSENPIAIFSGNEIPRKITTYSNQAWVHFSSDPFETGKGFELKYKAYTNPYCSGTKVLKDDSGTITDGSNDDQYNLNAHCGWLIQPEQAKAIILNFSSFNLEFAEEDGKTYYDYLEVFDGDSENAPSLGKFSGNTLPKTIISTQGSMFIRFNSNMNKQYNGFTASYLSLTETYCIKETITTINTGILTDGSSNLQYGNNTNCKFIISPEEADSITLVFSEFSTEEDNDVILIFEGTDTTAKQLGVFSGNEIPSPITSSTGKMLLWFVTDESVRGEGWKATYTAYNQKNEQILDLKKGWNLISLYIYQKNNAIDSVFKPILTDIEIIKDNDAFYSNQYPEFLKSLKTIENGKAYLVKCNNNCQLQLKGSLLNNSVIEKLSNLNSGWHLVGCPYPVEKPFNTIFNNDNLLQIKNFEGFYDPNDTKSTLQLFVPGMGYFVKIK